MTPDLGNGGGTSLEDAVVLGRHIGNSIINNGGLIVPGDMAKAIDDYVKERRWRASMLVTASYLSGRMQQGDKWWIKFLRDRAFYKYFFSWLARLAVVYDCGKLPAISYGEADRSSKED
jgi:2-polyprenyl-6-methoxyphenol hydroxylase-like FAD-dependent oxidoreductase